MRPVNLVITEAISEREEAFGKVHDVVTEWFNKASQSLQAAYAACSIGIDLLLS